MLKAILYVGLGLGFGLGLGLVLGLWLGLAPCEMVDPIMATTPELVLTHTSVELGGEPSVK